MDYRSELPLAALTYISLIFIAKLVFSLTVTEVSSAKVKAENTVKTPGNTASEMSLQHFEQIMIVHRFGDVIIHSVG